MKKVLLTIILLPVSVYAGSTEIINNISVSASDGDNVVLDGEVIEGNSGSSVKIYTEINGEVIENFDQNIEDGKEIDYQSEKKFDSGSIETKIKMETKTDTETDMEDEASKLNSDIDKINENKTTIGEKIRQIIKYVFSLFKF